MDLSPIILGVISSITTVVVAVIAAKQAMQEKRLRIRDKAAAERQKLREHRDRLQLKMIATTIELSLIAAKKLSNHQTNGEVEVAIRAASTAQQEYKEFCELAVHDM